MEEVMPDVTLKTRIREEKGKKAIHKLRGRGDVPAILYGHREQPVHLTLQEHELWLILHNATSEHLILTLSIEGSTEGDILTLVRDVQHHPVTGDIMHVDFQRISIDEKIKVGVPVEISGIARGVKEFGGILDHGVREVLTHCTPKQIPKSIVVDVSEMEIGDTIHLSDVTARYPELEFLDDPNVALVHVSPPKKLEVPAEAVPAEAAAAEGEAAAAEEEAEGEGEES
jgi:large subunit ribosomal protein L25